MNVSTFIWKRVHEWGGRIVYGYPGDGVGGLDVAIERAKDIIRYVQVRHEEMAAFMATGHAKFTGEVGVCYATSGPGAIHLLNGLYDAKMDHVPVVAIVGQQARTSMGADYQQEVDLQSAFKDVAGEYVMTAMVPQQVRQLIDRAFRIASTRRCVTCVIVPNDLQELDYEDPPVRHGTTHTGTGIALPSGIPDPSSLQRAADVLNAGKKVAMLVGAGALGATNEVIAVAEKLQAGVAKALLGKGVLPDDIPWVTGNIGLLGTKPSWDMMQDCDTLLMVGSSFPYSEFLPKPGSARGVLMDPDDCRVDHDLTQPFAGGLGGHRLEEPLPPARVDPPPEPVVDRRPVAEVARQVAPGAPDAGPVEDGLEEHPVGQLRLRPQRRPALFDHRAEDRPRRFGDRVTHGSGGLGG